MSSQLSQLKKIFEQRWKDLKKNSREKAIKLPPKTKNELRKIVLNSWNNGFKCEYCGMQMMAESNENPSMNTFSLDHKHPLSSGGDNSLSNFAIVCLRCNIEKGTMRASTYMQLLNILKKDYPSLLDRIHTEIWSGRYAKNIERNSKRRERSSKRRDRDKKLFEFV